LKNDYDPSRAHLVIYNWSGAKEVSIDLSGFLARDDQYAVFDPKHFYQSPVLSGKYAGPINLPIEKEFGAYLIVRL
jgi:hypothetical protein